MDDLFVEKMVFASVIILLGVFGLITNAVAFVTIWESSRLRSVFHVLIASLCVSDFISAAVSPFFAYRRTWGAQTWKLGDAMCKAVWGLDYWTSFVTSIHITFFAILRLISICRTQAFVHFTLRHARIFIALSWGVAGLAGCVPMAFWTGVYQLNATAPDPWCRNKKSDDYNWPSCTFTPPCYEHFRWYTTIAYSIFFYLPTLVMLATTYAITSTIRKQRRARLKLMGFRTFPNRSEVKRRRKEKQITMQLVLIIGSFIVGYFPRTAYHFYTLNTGGSKHNDWLFGMASYACLRLSESLNPVFYYLSSGKMRLETKRLISSSWYREAVEKKRAKSLQQQSQMRTVSSK